MALGQASAVGPAQVQAMALAQARAMALGQVSAVEPAQVLAAAPDQAQARALAQASENQMVPPQPLGRQMPRQ